MNAGLERSDLRRWARLALAAGTVAVGVAVGGLASTDWEDIEIWKARYDVWRDPGNWKTHYDLGFLLQRRAKSRKDPVSLEQAVASYQRAAERTDYYLPRHSLASAWVEAGLLDRARPVLEAIIREGVTDSSVYGELGWILYRQGDFEAALAMALKGVASYPKDQVAVHLLREVMRDSHRRPGPRDSALYRLLGKLLAGLSDSQGAAQAFQRAAELEGRAVRSPGSLGRAGRESVR